MATDLTVQVAPVVKDQALSQCKQRLYVGKFLERTHKDSLYLTWPKLKLNIWLKFSKVQYSSFVLRLLKHSICNLARSAQMIFRPTVEQQSNFYFLISAFETIYTKMYTPQMQDYPE